ncbi:uncharacterized protein BP5553_01848 [Venustampulla echinocandica]|uniref:Uncharacterized protein n=1 Tax=Venustampulla echinocandica TaxID=2656787 RepID=A0A370U257_9HELO|nr:uncharacterized protein BP5553_01848 [Venustampulla echinocandica]RDL41869.1 hypothetical protein BP5553_01848 [Venustampulla echinocandica]
MTPAGNSAKALQQNRPRPTVPRPIVPAVPLTYVQKRPKHQVTSAKPKAQEDGVQAAPSATVVDEQPSSPITEATPAITNGTLGVQAPEENKEPTSPQATIASDGNKEVTQSAADEREGSAQEPLSEDRQQTPRTDPSDGRSSTSRSTYQMPPASFLPANQNHFPSQPVFNNHPAMHHSHPSVGSVRFGAYGGSDNSSPAPPLSAENAPPYPFPPPPPPPQHVAARYGPQQSNGGPTGHSHQLSNGYSPMGPPGLQGFYPRQDGMMNQGPGTDNFARRQMAAFGPPDGYSPSHTPFGMEAQRFNTYDPSTPHSFQGSQSSAPNEPENGLAFHARHPTAVISNGNNGHIDDIRLYQQPPRPNQRTGSQVLAPGPNIFTMPPPPQLPMGVDHLDGLVNYLQSQFGNATFADYTLELRYSDDRAPPVRIPGHNLMLARSPTLKLLMTAQAQESDSDGMVVRTILIESDDPFLRSDAFWMAMQRLYGAPLLDLGALAAINVLPNTQLPSPMPGTPADRFDLALGYAAAGHLLRIPPVISRGIEIASHFVNWATIEKALDFALDGGLDSQWTLQSPQNNGQCPSTYGPAVNMLIHQSLNFIIPSFPPNFELDTSAGDFTRSRRLPAVIDEKPTANPRLSSIKFGDHPTEESVRSTTASAEMITLSKVLLNLPFHLLKYVLESPRLGNVQGWATTALRQKVMHDVVEEREKRRIKVHSNPHVPNAKRKANEKAWETVGWQEAVEHLGGNEATPTLTRTWVEFLL